MTYSRRHFIQQMAIGAGAIALPSVVKGNCLRKRQTMNLGFIAGIVKDELEKDWKGTLKKAASFGYKEFETGKHYGSSVKEFLSFCKDINLTPVGGGISMSRNIDEVKRKLDELAALKLKYAVAYWPWFVSAPFSLENCKESAGALNKMGEAAKEYGLKLLWHNHDHEFKAMDEGLPFDYLMQHTEKDLVYGEMDVYWVTKGGADPVTYLQKYSGRFHALHLKDMAKDPSEDFACVGEGRIDFKAILQEATKQNITHLFVEKDNAENGLACLQGSSAYLHKIIL